MILFTQIRLPWVLSYVMIKNLFLSVWMEWIKVSQPIFADPVVSFSLKNHYDVLLYMSILWEHFIYQLLFKLLSTKYHARVVCYLISHFSCSFLFVLSNTAFHTVTNIHGCERVFELLRFKLVYLYSLYFLQGSH